MSLDAYYKYMCLPPGQGDNPQQILLTFQTQVGGVLVKLYFEFLRTMALPLDSAVRHSGKSWIGIYPVGWGTVALKICVIHLSGSLLK